jgi:hypothetical protein
VGFFDPAALEARPAFMFDSSRTLNCSSNLIGHDHPNKPANGVAMTGRWTIGRGPCSGASRRPATWRDGMFREEFDFETATPVDASAIPDVLFERGMYWASGRAGIVNLVAAHKWFNLAALKGRVDAIPMRREVAELMSEDEIAMAQREARAWMTMN